MKYILKVNSKENRCSFLFLALVFLSVLIFVLNFVCPVKIFSFQKDNQPDIVSGVVPHHLLAKNMIDRFFEHISSQGKVESIILLSPDHFKSAIINHNKSFIGLDQNMSKETFFNLQINTTLSKLLSRENMIISDNSAISYDHGITNLLSFIKKYCPNANILPILIPENISQKQIEKLVKIIDRKTSSSTVMIASVDFSHYLPYRAAYFHDKKSIRTLLNFEQAGFKNIEVDCWQALYAIRFFAQLRKSENPYIIDHKCANDFMDLKSEETTSYFSLAYSNKGSDKVTSDLLSQDKNRKVKTILFTGDMMLDRGVKELINQNNIYYPFLNILQFLRGIDIVFGNLEGPITCNPPNDTYQALKFSFKKESAKTISSAGFNLLSLANNHTLDMKEKGFRETTKTLKENQIDFIGNPFYGQLNKEEVSFIFEDIIFYAFNQILPFGKKDDKIVNIVKESHFLNPDKFLIISLHWGFEYQLNCSLAQEKLAHRIIEAGADLIIGHHPHVVQNIEKYKERLIFYSLGNFIFDQYFSRETQEGLAVGLEIYPGELVFNLFPLQIDLSKPSLMKRDRSNDFLIQLAARSDKQLVEEIKRGIINIKRR